MAQYAKPLARLVAEFERLPGIGPKSAQRLAFYVLRLSDDEAQGLANAITEVKAAVGYCESCYNFTDQKLCEICRDPRRDEATICVVSDPRDLMALERMSEFRGKYHVLGGVLAPMEGIGPDQLKVRELLARLTGGHVKEIVVATNPTVEGDATAIYLANLLRPLGPKITRIAHGVPVGGDLDYADQATLIQAFEGRREL
ncbi:recombination mediator RecR [Armatimonas sp.]|uniref:recombination mediator RecR n=1 Tax=Armatimonas sp. TaxID=1872638 RepID=UPI00286A3093|nr:recombination mediator RecR [Armatimonas sp.]